MRRNALPGLSGRDIKTVKDASSTGSCAGKGLTMIEYKVVELAVVTDETIEEALNGWTTQGWYFDSIQFVVREASKRPSMAFVLFTREAAGAQPKPL